MHIPRFGPPPQIDLKFRKIARAYACALHAVVEAEKPLDRLWREVDRTCRAYQLLEGTYADHELAKRAYEEVVEMCAEPRREFDRAQKALIAAAEEYAESLEIDD